jgi:glycosidase
MKNRSRAASVVSGISAVWLAAAFGVAACGVTSGNGNTPSSPNESNDSPRPPGGGRGDEAGTGPRTGAPGDPGSGADASDASAPLQDASAPDGSNGALDGGTTDAGAADGGDTSLSDPKRYRRQVIYLVMTDRFENGRPENDGAGVPNCVDPNDLRRAHGGDLEGLRKRIPYLKELGVTAVWTTPVYKQATGNPARPCPYHGYWIDFADPDEGDVEPRLGGEADFRALLGGLREAGIEFVLDMVVNHSADNARILRQRPGWFHDEATCRTLGDPEETCPFRSGIPDFAQEIPEVATYLTDISRGWIERFPVGSIRMDTVKHVPAAYFRDSFLPAVRAARPGLFIFGEAFTEDERVLSRYLDAGFDGMLGFPVYGALTRVFGRQQSVDDAANTMSKMVRTFGQDRLLDMVNFVDNHDVPRFVNVPGFGTPPAEILRRYRLALTALFALPGIPQIYYANELAMYGGADPDNRRRMPAWAWDDATRDRVEPSFGAGNAKETFDFVKRLIAVRKSERALTDGGYAELWRQNGAGRPNVWAFGRAAGDEVAIAVLNADTREQEVRLGFGPLPDAAKRALADGTVVRDVVRSGAPAELTVTSGTLRVRLPAQTPAIYVIPRAR